MTHGNFKTYGLYSQTFLQEILQYWAAYLLFSILKFLTMREGGFLTALDESLRKIIVLQTIFPPKFLPPS